MMNFSYPHEVEYKNIEGLVKEKFFICYKDSLRADDFF